MSHQGSEPDRGGPAKGIALPFARIYLARHGQSESNRERRLCGQLDPPLSAVGMQQSRQLARVLAHVPLDAIFTSTLRRTAQMAAPIAAARGLAVAPLPGRGDPDIVRLDETFARVDAIRDKVVYTGYVAPERPVAFPPRRNQILVSQGGGQLGREMLSAAIRVAPLLPHYRFLVAAASRTSPEGLAALWAEVCSDNVEIVPFLADFQRHLLESALSINLGGDNTLMDVITTRTPSLAYPSQDDSEQGLRIGKLAAAGFVFEIGPADLETARLRARIEQVLATPYPERPIATEGARVTAEKIGAILAQRAGRAQDG